MALKVPTESNWKCIILSAVELLCKHEVKIKMFSNKWKPGICPKQTATNRDPGRRVLCIISENAEQNWENIKTWININ